MIQALLSFCALYYLFLRFLTGLSSFTPSSIYVLITLSSCPVYSLLILTPWCPVTLTTYIASYYPSYMQHNRCWPLIHRLAAFQNQPRHDLQYGLYLHVRMRINNGVVTTYKETSWTKDDEKGDLDRGLVTNRCDCLRSVFVGWDGVRLPRQCVDAPQSRGTPFCETNNM